MLVVNSGVPAKSVQELIALAKAQPGQITAASSGVGTTNHLSLEMFKSMARIDLLHVPYKGGGPAIVGPRGRAGEGVLQHPGHAVRRT